MNRRLLSVKETAEYLGLRPQTVYNRISNKAAVPFPVRPKRVGRLVRFDIRDLERYIDALDNQSSGE